MACTLEFDQPKTDYRPAPAPIDEANRLAAVHRTGVMGKPHDDKYNTFIHMAKLVTGCPIAYIGLFDEERQFFLARDFDGAFNVDELPRHQTLCQYAINSTEPMIVTDLRLHPDLKNNPLVASAPHWVFWAAFPIVSDNGLVLGTLCAADYRAREKIDEEKKAKMMSLSKHLSRDLSFKIRYSRDVVDLLQVDASSIAGGSTELAVCSG